MVNNRIEKTNRTPTGTVRYTNSNVRRKCACALQRSRIVSEEERHIMIREMSRLDIDSAKSERSIECNFNGIPCLWTKETSSENVFAN